MTLSEIQQSFYSRTFDFEAVSTWLLAIGAIIVLLLLGVFLKTLIERRMRYKPHGSISDENAIREILREAFDQRRPFEVQIQTLYGQRRPTLRCAPEYVGQVSMTVEINGLNTLSERWLGRQVMVFFRILLAKKFTYYTFASKIDGIHSPKEGVCHITLPLPSRLENRQKRSFLRISPPDDFILGAALWCGDDMPKPESLQELSDWPRPTLLQIPGRTQQFQMLDLSAGGARLGMVNQIIRSYRLRFSAVEQVILMLDLFDPEQDKRLRFWLLCRIQNIWREHATRDIQMGLQFLAWAKPKETLENTDQVSGIEWLRLSSSNEVEPLGNWIMRRHLELFRDSPVDPE